MNEQIERQLDVAAASDSRGYVTDRPVKHTAILLDGGPGGTIGLAKLPDADVEVAPLASVTELLDRARSQGH